MLRNPRRYRGGCRTLPYLRHEFVYERSRFWSQPQRLDLLRANKPKMLEFRHPQSFEAGNFAETQAFKDRRIRSLSMLLTSVVPPRSFRRTIHRLGEGLLPLVKISYALIQFTLTRTMAKTATGSKIRDQFRSNHVHITSTIKQWKKQRCDGEVVRVRLACTTSEARFHELILRGEDVVVERALVPLEALDRTA